MVPTPLRQIVPGIHVAEAPQRFAGMEIGTRMTVLELEGGLVVHSPIAVDPDSIAHLGTPRWVIAPNLFHHLYVGPWAEAGLEVWGAAGLPEKRSDLDFHGELDRDTHPFGPELELCPLTCFPFTNEVAVLHRPSRTLLVADLVFNVAASAPWRTRATMRLLGGYPGCRTTLIERFGMKRPGARRELSEIASWDFDRIIMAHGEIVETGGHAAFREAFRWLSLS